MHFSKIRLLMLGLGGLVLLGVALAFAYRYEIVISMVSRSHIEANVPPPSNFDADLARDLRAWFTQRQGSPAKYAKLLVATYRIRTGRPLECALVPAVT